MEQDKKLIEIETMLTYQEKLISELNLVVVEHSKELMAVKKQLKDIVKLLNESNQPTGKESPPPHY